MRDGLLIHDDADRTPQVAPGRHPLSPISGADFSRKPGMRLPAQGWIILTILCVLPVLLALWAAYSAVQSLLFDHPWVGPWFGAVLVLVAFVVLVGLVFTLAARAWVSVQQARVIRTAHGAPVDVVAAMRLDPYQAEAQQIALELAKAPYLSNPNLSTLSIQSPTKPDKLADLPALPAPIDVAPIVPDTWLSWLNRTPHIMLAAETGGGKTTTALHLLAPRLASGEQVYIIDPNASGWGGLPSIGGGEDWQAVGRAMDAVITLYAERQQQRARALADTRRELPHDAFTRLTVIVDEAYMAKQALDTGKDSIWRRFVPILGSGARKVGISVVLLTQTVNVEDIGLSAPLRENYTRLALDSAAARKLIIAEEPDRARRAALLAALAGLKFPAVTERDGQCVLLDRSGFEQTPNLTRYAEQTWVPDSFTLSQVVPSVSGQQGSAGGPSSHNGTVGRWDEGQQDAERFKETMVIGLKRMGRTREQIRQELQALGLGLRNGEYTEILARHGLN